MSSRFRIGDRSIWGGRAVSPETVSQRIKLLRDALSDDPANPRYVEGVRGQGYRLLLRVEVLPPESPARHRPRWSVPIGAAISVAAAAAMYFADYTRALRAVGDEVGANRMLDHLEAILTLRRERGLFIEERHAAEALALRGQTEAPLDALEKAERDRTIYHRWRLVLLHNEIFAGFRNHPRFMALVEKITRDLSRQREQLKAAEN